MKNDASHLRVSRLKAISQKIASGFDKADSLNLQKLKTYVMYNFGLSEKKTVEYVSLCCDVHDWKINNGSITKVQA